MIACSMVAEAEEPVELSASSETLNGLTVIRIPPPDAACLCRTARSRPSAHSMRRVLRRPTHATRGLARRLGRVRRAAAGLEKRVARLREENRRLKKLLSRKEERSLCEIEETTDGEDDVDSVLGRKE